MVAFRSVSVLAATTCWFFANSLRGKRTGGESLNIDGASLPCKKILTDATDAIRVADSTGLVRCCCDMNSKTSWKHSQEELARSRRCVVLPHVKKCGDVVKPRANWATGALHHYSKTGGKCLVDEDDAELILHAVGTDSVYCTLAYAFVGPRIRMPPITARLDESVSVPCPSGYRSNGPHLCTFASSRSGAFFPVPNCTLVDVCSGRTGKGGSHVPNAGLGVEVEVTCDEGKIPRHHAAVCGIDGEFLPEPECRKGSTTDDEPSADPNEDHVATPTHAPTMVTTTTSTTTTSTTCGAGTFDFTGFGEGVAVAVKACFVQDGGDRSACCSRACDPALGLVVGRDRKGHWTEVAERIKKPKASRLNCIVQCESAMSCQTNGVVPEWVRVRRLPPS